MIGRKHWRAIVSAAAFAQAVSIFAAIDGTTSNPAPPAAPALGPETWLRVHTVNFTIFGQVPEARLRMIGDRLEAYRTALERLHPGTRASPRETSVFVFKSAASGSRYTLASADEAHHLGINPPYDVPNYVTVAAPVDDPPLDLLYHAYAHQFLDDNFPRLPLTINEGLAEFYSAFTITPQGMLIGMANGNHVRWLKEHELLPLSRQLSLDVSAPQLADVSGREAFMACSWAFIHYLVSGSGENRSKLPAFLEALHRGSPPGTAVLTAYGWSFDRMQEELDGYVKRNHFLPIRIASEGPKPGPVESSPMERDEVYAGLGDLLAHAGPVKVAEAEAHLREALRLNPSQGRALAGLGYLSYSQDRFAEAIPFLEKSLAIEPNAMTCYLLARCLLRTNAVAQSSSPVQGPGGGTPAWLARVRSLLSSAIQMRPRFAAPYVTLGATHTRPDGDVAAGIELLDKARAMLPARMDIAGNLVYLLLRKGDVTRAQALTDQVLANGGDPEALQAARRAIATYQDHVRARQSVEDSRPSPEEEARMEKYRASLAKMLRQSLAEATDPEVKARIEAQLKELEAPSSPSVAEVYNQAVELANQRDYARAIPLLEGLLQRVGDEEMTSQIKKLLERFRQDAARLQQTVH